jgi:hypothetical protein
MYTNQGQGVKDPNTAFLLEFAGGFFGLLGLGHLYGGKTTDGVVRLIGWIIYDIMAAIIISLLLAVFIGIICLPIQLLIQIGIPLWSGLALKKQMQEGRI